MIGSLSKNYLHISLTQKCNLSCVYCKPEKMYYDSTFDKLTVEDYKFLIKSMSELGVSKVRFSGGEPLLYPRLIELIKFAKEECHVEDIGIITNGGSLKKVLKSIEICTRLGLETNINCVTIDGFNNDELYDFMLMTNYYPIDVRFREIVPIGEAIKIYKQGYFNVGQFINEINELILVENNERLGTKYYKYNGAKGRIGVIAPLSSSHCNKIKVTSNGYMKLGSSSDIEIDIREYLQKPMMFKETIKEIIK